MHISQKILSAQQLVQKHRYFTHWHIDVMPFSGFHSVYIENDFLAAIIPTKIEDDSE